MTRLDDDLDAFLNAPDAPSRNQALAQWLTDATPLIVAMLKAIRSLKQLERRILALGLYWNPQRQRELSEDRDP